MWLQVHGLAAGKGVIVCNTIEEGIQSVDKVMVEKTFGEAGNRVVVEEYLVGEEASYVAFTDGKAILPMASSQDHKAIFDGARAPTRAGWALIPPHP